MALWRNGAFAISTASRRSTDLAPSRARRSARRRSRSAMSRARRSTRARLCRPPRAAFAAPALEIDASTRANLELTRTLSGERAGSLLAAIDLTLTSAGARQLAERLASPLTRPGDINRASTRCLFRGGGGAARRFARDFERGAGFHPRVVAAESRSRRPARSRRDARRAERRAARWTQACGSKSTPSASLAEACAQLLRGRLRAWRASLRRR